MNDMTITLDGDNGDYTEHGEHRVMYRIVESLWCMPNANVTPHINYTSIRITLIKAAECWKELGVGIGSAERRSRR